MSDIKYYALNENEEPPKEFVVIMHVSGEPKFVASYINTCYLSYENSVLLKIHERNDQLREENAKLAEQYEAVIVDYRSEVAKLRELANGYEALTATLCNERECDSCPFDGTEQIVCEHMRLQTCLRELGIEVTA